MIKAIKTGVAFLALFGIAAVAWYGLLTLVFGGV